MSEPNPEVDALAHMMGNLNRPVVVSFQPRQSIHRPCLMLVTGPWYNYVPILSREPDEKTLMFVLTDRVLSPVEVLARVIGGDHVRLSNAGRLASIAWGWSSFNRTSSYADCIWNYQRNRL